MAGGAFRRLACEDAAVGHPEIARQAMAMYVGAAATDLGRRPERYHVVVTSDLFGYILRDLAAEATGGLALAPSANLHPGRHAPFEPRAWVRSGRRGKRRRAKLVRWIADRLASNQRTG